MGPTPSDADDLVADQPAAIVVANLSKSYRIWSDPSQRLISPIMSEVGKLMPDPLARLMQAKAERGYQDFFALKDVSFEVKRGEAVGIVGRNGAGKSTLLQIIAGTLRPTTGNCRVNGRVAALLELGAGFNSDFTGRENVFLSGAVLGLSKAEVSARFDEIAAFADIGEFIEQPVKTYSSGMLMRLAFAVNTCVDPDILIVDEALGVGDAPFQAKCYRRLRHLISRGVSLLFVSHDIGTVRSICTRALWLKNGRAELWGEAMEVAKEYEKFCWSEQGTIINRPQTPSGDIAPEFAPPSSTTEGAVAAQNASKPPAFFPPELLQPNPVFHQTAGHDRYGTKGATLLNMIALDDKGDRRAHFAFNETIHLHFLARVNEDVDTDIVLGIRLKDLHGNYVYSVQDIVTQHKLRGRAGDTFHFATSFPLPLTHGKFIIKTGFFGFTEGESRIDGKYDYGRAILWDVIEDCGVIEVDVFPFMPLCGPAHAHAPLAVGSVKVPATPESPV